MFFLIPLAQLASALSLNESVTHIMLSKLLTSGQLDLFTTFLIF